MLPYINDFLRFLSNLSYSSETIYNYERDLKVLEQFLEECQFDFDHLDKKAVLEYKAYLASRDRKTLAKAEPGEKMLDSRSVNRMLSALRSFLKYLIEMDYPCPLAPEAVKHTKTERKHPQVAELEDLVRLIEAPSKLESNTKVALRNRAILEVLFATGMRISELCNLNRDQIDGSGRLFITRGEMSPSPESGFLPTTCRSG